MPRPPKNPLPWKKSRGGCSADVGTVFCVELTEQGWECRKKPPRGKEEVLADELPSESAAKQVAQRAYTKALKEGGEVEAAGAAKAPKGKRGGRRKAAKRTAAASRQEKNQREAETTAAPEAAAPAPPLDDVIELDDGCVCGRIAGVRWVAEPSGRVEFLRDVPAEEAARVQSKVTAYFAQKKAPAARRGRPPGRRAAKPVEAPAAPAEPKRRGRPPGSKNKPKAQPRKKPEEKAEEPMKKRRGRPSGSKNKPKAEKASGKDGAEEASGNGKSSGAEKPNGNGKANGNGAAKAAGQALEWTEVGENFRASVPSGYFEIVPEGSDYALYFADLNGSSTFLKNGEKTTLMQVAAERNSRGMGAAPAAVASTNLDELFAQAIRG